MPSAARLEVQMRHRIGTLAIDVDFVVTQAWTVLFGPSGSGKSTILRAIAGLVHPLAGKIQWQPANRASDSVQPLFDSHTKCWTPTHRRHVSLAPQSASLFPHMTVLENVTYTSSRQLTRTEADRVLTAFRIAHVAGKRPAQLSGGEAQRVNIARAAFAASKSGLLLLDEPFTGMDVALRSELIQALQAWAANCNVSVISVTHDIAEAFQLGADVIKIADGRVVQQGPVELVLAEERESLLTQLRSPA
jgi:molybdate transport system ATP-binding protein